MTAHDPDLARALQPWDGSWFYPVPDTGMRFVSLDQHTALQILRGREGLSNADARLLQAIAVHEGELSPGQRFWLDRLARAHDRRLGQ
ncbi:hypothetical protein [Pelagerythrobacter sp.]|uniref:hypothetical protein n=1 Tax=Pelagerythrobacter sp. TaxID=2800702 RepID=UPI0035B45F9E